MTMHSNRGYPAAEPEVITLGPHRFDDLGTLIDHVHTLFADWEQDTAPGAAPDVETLHRAKLAAHEWLANLVQHAAFQERQPDILLELKLLGASIGCVIEDNSEGFDLRYHLLSGEEQLDPCPERGMGLLMLDACTEDLTYRPVGNHRNRLSFSISADKDPWLDIPFHL